METPTDRRTSRRSWPRKLGTGAATLLAAGILGSSASAGAATTSNAPTAAFGSVAALNASSMEVQNPSSGQTTVNWTSSTTFSKSVTESVSAVSVGDCVTATGTASKKSKTTIAARSITVTTPSSSGTCGPTGARFGTRTGSGGPPAGGFKPRSGSGSGQGNFPEGGPRNFPGGGAAGNNFRQRLANLAIASGKVTAVNGSTITVSGISISPGTFTPPGKSSSSKQPAKPKTQTLKVTASSSTPVNTSQSVNSGALAVGDCVSAFGPAATNGSVTATTVRITSTGGASCTGGFFGGRGGAGGFFGAPGGGGA